jgi:hypothetical protein
MSKLILTLIHDFEAGQLWGFDKEKCCGDPSHHLKGEELRRFSVGWNYKLFGIKAALFVDPPGEFEMTALLKYKSSRGGYYKVNVNEDKGAIEYRVKASFITNKLYPDTVKRLDELKDKVDWRLTGIMFKWGAMAYGTHRGFDGNIVGQDINNPNSCHRITEWSLVD